MWARDAELPLNPGSPRQKFGDRPWQLSSIRLKSEFPDAAIQAVEATSIDRIAMKFWWEARIATLKAAQKFAEFARHQRGDEALH